MRWFAVRGAAALLVISLAIKFIVLNRPEPTDDRATQVAAIREVMASRGFATQAIEGESVLASRGSCRVRIWPYSPYGTFRLAIERENASIGETAFVYRGKRLGDPPKAWPLLQFYVQRELARMGIAVPRPAILAIAKTPSCGVLPLGWPIDAWQR